MDAPAVRLFRAEDVVTNSLPVRGIDWVLRWAATLGLLAAAAVLLAMFSYQLSAERALASAAAAGLREATCERATPHSIEAAVRRELGEHRRKLQRAIAVSVSLPGPRSRATAVHLSVPAAAVMPDWLESLLPALPNLAVSRSAESGRTR